MVDKLTEYFVFLLLRTVVDLDDLYGRGRDVDEINWVFRNRGIDTLETVSSWRF